VVDAIEHIDFPVSSKETLAKNISAVEWGLLCNYHVFM